MNKMTVFTMCLLFFILLSTTVLISGVERHRRGEIVPSIVERDLLYRPDTLRIDTIRYYPCKIDTSYYRAETTYIDDSNWTAIWVRQLAEELSDTIEYEERYDTLWCHKNQVWLTPSELKRLMELLHPIQWDTGTICLDSTHWDSVYTGPNHDTFFFNKYLEKMRPCDSGIHFPLRWGNGRGMDSSETDQK